VNDDLWALLAERNVFVFVHPSGVPDATASSDYWLPQLVGYPMETALSIARMIYGRVFERFDLNMCLAHGGGCLPWLRGRLDLGWERKEIAHTTKVPPSEFCKRLYYDTAVFDPRCCPISSPTWVQTTSCWAPTTRLNWATADPWRRFCRSVSAPRTQKRSCGARRIPCSRLVFVATRGPFREASR
jgi:hypothetical protein